MKQLQAQRPRKRHTSQPVRESYSDPQVKAAKRAAQRHTRRARRATA